MDRQAELEAFVTQKMQDYHVPGVSIGLLTADGPQVHTFGITNVDHPMPVTADTLFQIGSNTKPMTATVMMLLAQDGTLDLDAPVRTIVPNFTVKDETVSASATVRQLLTHSTGWIGDHFIDTGAGDDAGAKYVASMAELGQIAPPHTVFSYNNSGFALAGHIIETVTGKPYAEVIAEMLFAPLGMQNSFVELGDVMLRSFAVGHNVQGDTATVAAPWPLPRAMYAAGAVAASAQDMLTFAQFYLDRGKTADGTQLLPQQMMDDLWTPQVNMGGDEGWVAHSWFVEDHDGHTAYRHGGATVGQLSAFRIVPSKQFAFTSLTNAGSGGPFNSDLEKWLLETYCDIVEPAPDDSFTPTTDQLNELVGRYSRPMVDIEIKLDDQELQCRLVFKQGFPTADTPVLPPTPWFAIALTSADALTVQQGPGKGSKQQIIRDADGAIAWILMGARLHAPS